MNKLITNLAQFRYILLFIYLFTLIVFGNILQNRLVMDDHDYVENWALIQDLKNIPQFFVGFAPHPRQPGIYSPVKTLIHAVNYQFFGTNPIGHHIFSLLVHFLGILFVYKIARLLTKNLSVSFLAALFFAIHPVHAEAISYVTASIDSLGVVFLFIAFYFYVQKKFWPALIWSAVAVFTHELNIVLPLLFLLFDICWPEEKEKFSKKIIRILPFVLIVIFYVWAKMLNLGVLSRGGYVYESIYLTFLIVLKAWAKYILIVFFPFILTHNHIISAGIYSFDIEDFDRLSVLSQSLFDFQSLLAILTLSIVFYYGLINFRRNNLIVFCIGWFFVSLLASAQIIPSGVYFAERYLYLANLGFSIWLAYILVKCFESDGEFWGLRQKQWAKVLVVFLVVFFSARTYWRNFDWRSDVSLFESAVRANPQSGLMRTDLGVVYIKDGLPEKALVSLNQALKIRPNDPVVYFSLADAYIELRQFPKAIDSLKKAVELKKDFAEAYFNLAMVYARWGMSEKAYLTLNESLKYYRQQGRFNEAAKADQAFKDYVQRMKGQKEPLPQPSS